MQDPFSLAGLRVLICGATGGIGRACAEAVTRQGASVVITGRRETVLAEVGRSLHEMASDSIVPAIAADLTNAADRSRLIAEIPELDGLVLASGITLVKPLRGSTAADLERVIGTNLQSVILLIHGLLRANRMRRGASIVILASIAARLGAPAHTLYSASKGGLVAFVRSLALEVSPSRVRVNSVSPGLVRTAMADRMGANWSDEQWEAYAREYPLGLGEPEDVAHLVTYLLSPAARWVTGQDWAIDGGVSIR